MRTFSAPFFVAHLLLCDWFWDANKFAGSNDWAVHLNAIIVFHPFRLDLTVLDAGPNDF